VRVVERGEGRVVLSGETLAPGDRVMVSDLPAPFDGKRVRIQEETAASATRQQARAAR
jgi:hypothetical protein